MDSSLARPVRGLLVLVMALLALATAVTQVAQEVGASFHTYSIALALFSLGLGAAVGRAELRGTFRTLRAHVGDTAALAALALAATTLALVSHRPRWDDFSYIPNVLHLVAHPEAAMGHVVHFVDGGRAAIESYYVGTSMPFEYAQGVVAHFLGLHVLSVYHVLAPALFGALVPLTWFYTLSRFEFSDRAAIAGAVLICLCLVLMGESHRGFGNYAFTRLWHGKVIVMALGLPLVVGLTLDFFRSPDWRGWLRLFATATALAGASTSSIVLLPLLAPPLALAAAVGLRLGPRIALARGLAYGASFVYVGAFGLAFLWLASAGLAAEDPVHEGFATTFRGQLQYVFPTRRPTTLLLALFSGAGALLLMRGWQWRFFAAWGFAVIAAYLNPVVAPWLMEHVAPNGVYWRLLYLLPFPLALGLTGSWLADRFGVGRSAQGTMLAIVVVALTGLAHLPADSTSIFRRNTSLGLGYQIDRLDRRLAERLIEASPPGPMLAPWYLGGVVTLLTADRPQIATRDAALGLWFESRGQPGEARLRREASEYLDGDRPDGHEAVLELVVRHPQIRSVVVRYGIGQREGLDGALSERGFTERRDLGEVRVLSRARAIDGQTGRAE